MRQQREMPEVACFNGLYANENFDEKKQISDAGIKMLSAAPLFSKKPRERG